MLYTPFVGVSMLYTPFVGVPMLYTPFVGVPMLYIHFSVCTVFKAGTLIYVKRRDVRCV